MMLVSVQLSPCADAHKNSPQPQQAGSIGLMPMSIVDGEGGLSALLHIKTDAINQLSSKFLITLSNEGPCTDR